MEVQINTCPFDYPVVSYREGASPKLAPFSPLLKNFAIPKILRILPLIKEFYTGYLTD